MKVGLGGEGGGGHRRGVERGADPLRTDGGFRRSPRAASRELPGAGRGPGKRAREGGARGAGKPSASRGRKRASEPPFAGGRRREEFMRGCGRARCWRKEGLRWSLVSPTRNRRASPLPGPPLARPVLLRHRAARRPSARPPSQPSRGGRAEGAARPGARFARCSARPVPAWSCRARPPPTPAPPVSRALRGLRRGGRRAATPAGLARLGTGDARLASRGQAFPRDNRRPTGWSAEPRSVGFGGAPSPTESLRRLSVVRAGMAALAGDFARPFPAFALRSSAFPSRARAGCRSRRSCRPRGLDI